MLVQRKLTTAQVLELIRDEGFDLEAQASRRRHDGYRSLATYREFEAILLPRVTRAGADQAKGRKLRSLYQQLEQKGRPAPVKPPSAEKKLSPRPQEQQPSPGRLGLALGLGAIGLGGLLVFLLLRYFLSG
jgi:hypothetical protein